MWNTVTLTLLATSWCLAFPPPTIYNYKSDQLNHEQTGVAGRAVSGGYGWTAPNGQKFSVNYIADNKGYRIVSSQNVFPQEGKPLDTVKPVAAAASKSVPPTFAAAPAKAKSTSFSLPSKPASSSFYSPQSKKSLARTHFGLSESTFNDPQPSTTSAPTPRPITVIFFNTTPKPARPSASVVPVPSKIDRPVVGRKSTAHTLTETKDSAGEAEAETVAGVEASGAKSAKSVAAPEEEAAPAEGAESEGTGAEGAEAEGGAEGGEAEGGEGGAEAEGGAEGGAKAEGGAEGGEAEGGEEEGAEEAEGQGEEGGEEGEEEEGSEYGYEEEDEEESGSSSAGEEW